MKIDSKVYVQQAFTKPEYRDAVVRVEFAGAYVQAEKNRLCDKTSICYRGKTTETFNFNDVDEGA